MKTRLKIKSAVRLGVTAIGFAVALMAAGAANASIIVNLSAGPTNPNGGPVTQTNGGPTANPVVVSFAAGTYTVSLIDNSANGGYTAYSVATPASPNYTEQFAGFSIGGLSGPATLLSNSPGRYSTAAAALAAYQALGPLTFTINSTTNIDFYIEDAAAVYFTDDTGGVSFSVSQVPEPWTISLFGIGLCFAAIARRRKDAKNA